MSYKTIVCGVTGSPHAQKAALEAASLAKENNARLVYVYVVDSGFVRGGITVEVSHHFVEDSLENLGNHILDHVEGLAKSLGVTPKKIVRKGEVLKTLKEVVMEEKADLLVIGHEERTFFEKALFKGRVEDHSKELEQETGATVTIVQ